MSGVGSNWVSSDDYLSWAMTDITSNDQRGWSNAVANSKRSVCRRIDTLLLCCQLDRYLKENYPERLRALQEVGLPAPNIVHSLIIDPRNVQEHAYHEVSAEAASHAVDIAHLFERATRPFHVGQWHEHSGFHRRFLFGELPEYDAEYHKKDGWVFRLHREPSSPLLAIACNCEAAVACIVDYSAEVTHQTPLGSFSRETAIRFAKWCMTSKPPYMFADRDFVGRVLHEFGITSCWPH